MGNDVITAISTGVNGGVTDSKTLALQLAPILIGATLAIGGALKVAPKMAGRVLGFLH
jgi:hypothetical protein